MKIQRALRTVRILPILALFLLNKLANGNLVDIRDSDLSAQQNGELQKFKELMIPQLEKEYMKKDVFLIRWLRARDFNIDKARDMLKKHLEWRKKHKFDTIHEQDWSYFEQEYPIYFDVTDTDGRPTMLANFGEWDIQKATISGQRDKLNLWVSKAVDKLERLVRDLQDKGSGITRWNILWNSHDLTEKKSVCGQCLPFYSELGRAFEENFPHGSSKVWFINSPSIFSIIVKLVQPILSAETKQSIKLFGTKKSDWEASVLQEFSKDQLPVRYGGLNANHPLN